MEYKAPVDVQVPDSAEAWVARVHSPDCTASDRAAFENWRDAHPEVIPACEQTERIYELSGELSQDLWLQMAARAARQRTEGVRRRAVPRLAWAAAAVLLLFVVGMWSRDFFTAAVHAQLYSTMVGEQRTLYFTDGTSVLLDTDSEVTVRYDSRQREVTLDGGRAQFTVAPDADRPFLVRAENGVIRDIGTRFQVFQNGSGVTVTLLSGAVRVSIPASRSSSVLSPGQQITYSGDRLGAVRAANVSVARGWTHGEMVFQDRTLAAVVDEMNRYSTHKLQLADVALGQLRVSGVFHAGDQTSLVQALRRGWGLRVRRASSHDTVLEPPLKR